MPSSFAICARSPAGQRSRTRTRRTTLRALLCAALLTSAAPAQRASAQGRPSGAAFASEPATTTIVARPAPQDTTTPFFFSDVRYGAERVLHGLTSPARWSGRQWLLVPATGMAAGLLVRTDGAVERFEDPRRSAAADAYFGAVEPFGQLASFGVVVGIYGSGVIFDRPALRRTAVEATAASVVAGGVITPLLKLAVGRARPRQDLGPYAFSPFSGDKSFPSGHTTQAFAVASVIATEAGSMWIKVLAYGMAGSVGAARIYHDAHFLSDVAVGATIGTLVGRSMVTSGVGRRGGVKPYVGASLDGGLTVGLAFSS